jgi:hypothetical protein
LKTGNSTFLLTWVDLVLFIGIFYPANHDIIGWVVDLVLFIGIFYPANQLHGNDDILKPTICDSSPGIAFIGNTNQLHGNSLHRNLLPSESSPWQRQLFKTYYTCWYGLHRKYQSTPG